MKFGAPTPQTPPVSRRRLRNVYQHPSLLRHEGPSPGTVSEARALTPTRALYAESNAKKSSRRRGEGHDNVEERQDPRQRQGGPYAQRKTSAKRSTLRSTPTKCLAREDLERPWTSSPRTTRSRQLSDYIQWIAHEMDGTASFASSSESMPENQAFAGSGTLSTFSASASSTASSAIYEEEQRSLQLTDLSDSISRDDFMLHLQEDVEDDDEDEDDFDDEYADEDGSGDENGDEDDETRRDLSNLRSRGLVDDDDARIMRLVGTVSDSVLELSLGGNGLRQIPSLPARLCVLSLRGNALESLRDLDHLMCLEELDASENQLTSLEGLYSCAQTLRTLNVRGNCLRRVSGLEIMVALQHLDLSQNQLGRLSDLRSLSCNVNLTELRLADNPVAALPTFRQLVMDMNPSVRILDDHLVSSSPQVGGAGPKEWTYGSLHASRLAARKSAARTGGRSSLAVNNAHSSSSKTTAHPGTPKPKHAAALSRNGKRQTSTSQQQRVAEGERRHIGASLSLNPARVPKPASSSKPRGRDTGGGEREMRRNKTETRKQTLRGATSDAQGDPRRIRRISATSEQASRSGKQTSQEKQRKKSHHHQQQQQRRQMPKHRSEHHQSTDNLSSSKLDTIGKSRPTLAKVDDESEVAFDDFFQETDARRVIERMRNASRLHRGSYQSRTLAETSPVTSLDHVDEPREVRGANQAMSRASLLEEQSGRRHSQDWIVSPSHSHRKAHDRFDSAGNRGLKGEFDNSGDYYYDDEPESDDEDDVTKRIQQLLARKRQNLQALTNALRESRSERSSR